jgi:hypothetical protein
MEELLPLLIGVIWLIYTIYNRGKKRGVKKQQPANEEEIKTPSILEQLLTGDDIFEPQPEEFAEESVEPQRVSSYDDEKQEEQKEKATPFLKTELAQYVNEKQQSTVSSTKHIKAEKSISEFEVDQLEFDLRKAIIFSEILNAPYIGYK